MYAERVVGPGEIERVFLQRRTGSGEVEVVVADRGEQRDAEDPNTRYFVLHDGRRYSGVPGTARFNVIEFGEHGIPYRLPTVTEPELEPRAMATLALLGSGNPEQVAELHWRLGVPLSTLILAILAVPLSRSQPRQGRYGRIATGFARLHHLLQPAERGQGVGGAGHGAADYRHLVGACAHAAARPGAARGSERRASPARVVRQDAPRMTGLLAKYLMRSILVSTLLVLIVLLALAGLFEFIAQVDNLEGSFGMPQALMYAALRLPQLSFEMLPIAVLIGSLLALGSLASNSELVVMRTAGLSVGRLAGMVAMSGFVLMVVTALVGEFIGPPLDYFARNMRNETRYEQENREFGAATWVRDGQTILHLERVNSEFEFGSIYMFRFGEDDQLLSIARAENSGIDDDDRWVLENYRATRFVGDEVEVVESQREVEQFNISSDVLGITLVKPVSLSARGLSDYIGYLRRNELSAERYEMELWSRIASTVTVVVMPVLALAFVFGSLRSAGAGSRLMVGVLIGLGYFLASETLANSGQVFDLNPAVVTWLPTLALFVITLLALSRVR
ncbi:MAG: LPS export ABC transporter permease LptG [Woeseiaceae bacterium]|nr:LPS export ABC transporter permease LptG [Woeseiaceae bacterium]